MKVTLLSFITKNGGQAKALQEKAQGKLRDDALNTPGTKDVKALVEGAALPDWTSIAGEGNSKTRDQFIQQVVGFGKLIPDLAWDIQEVLGIVTRGKSSQSGNRITIKDGKLAQAHHLEDWTGAIRQLK